jgi:lactate permease
VPSDLRVYAQNGVAARTSGGPLLKGSNPVSPTSLTQVGAPDRGALSDLGGDIFRKVIGWSLVLLVLMCIIVALQATPVLGWTVP